MPELLTHPEIIHPSQNVIVVSTASFYTAGILASSNRGSKLADMAQNARYSGVEHIPTVFPGLGASTTTLDKNLQSMLRGLHETFNWTREPKIWGERIETNPVTFIKTICDIKLHPENHVDMALQAYLALLPVQEAIIEGKNLRASNKDKLPLVIYLRPDKISKPINLRPGTQTELDFVRKYYSEARYQPKARDLALLNINPLQMNQKELLLAIVKALDELGLSIVLDTSHWRTKTKEGIELPNWNLLLDNGFLKRVNEIHISLGRIDIDETQEDKALKELKTFLSQDDSNEIIKLLKDIKNLNWLEDASSKQKLVVVEIPPQAIKLLLKERKRDHHDSLVSMHNEIYKVIQNTLYGI